MSIRKNALALVFSLPCLLAGRALAQQTNPELGDVNAHAGADASATLPPAPAPATETTNASLATFGVANSGTDHSLMVGHLGVGTFGALELPRMGCDVTAAGVCTPTPGVLKAATLGARYWLDETMAIEAGLGLGWATGSRTTDINGMSTKVHDPSLFGMALHAGLPLVFATSKHFAFEFVPELNVGFVTGGWDDTRGVNQDLDLSGFMLELGGRVGAEIQFGFIDIPQLALQASVGLHMRYEGINASNGDNSLSHHNFGLSTTVDHAPWDIFVASITAIYYL